MGSAAVFRKDLKPLDPDYLAAFCGWIEDSLLPKFTNANRMIKDALANEVDDEDRRRKIIMIKDVIWGQCTRKEFRKCCKEGDINLSAL